MKNYQLSTLNKCYTCIHRIITEKCKVIITLNTVQPLRISVSSGRSLVVIQIYIMNTNEKYQKAILKSIYTVVFPKQLQKSVRQL